MFGVPLGELAVRVAAIVIGGVITGLLAGLFGVGGGAVIVPVLYEIFRAFDVPDDVRMQLCVGTRSRSSCRPRYARSWPIEPRAACRSRSSGAGRPRWSWVW